MKNIFLILFIGALACGAGDCVEFSEEKILDYAGFVRIPEEGCQYVRDLPPEDIRKLGGMLDFNRGRRGPNTHIMGMILMKARDLEKRNTPYDRDYVFGTLAAFIHAQIDKGDIRAGNMNRFTGFHHTELEKMAEESLESEDELSRDNARLWLKQHESYLRNQARRDGRDASLASRRLDKNAPTRSAPPPANRSGGDEAGAPFPWLGVAAAITVLFAACLAWLKTGRRSADV